MNFWRRGVGLEWIFFIARSLELRALPYASNRPPRAAASFNQPAAPNRAGRVLFVSHFAFLSLGLSRPVSEPGRWAAQTHDSTLGQIH